MRDPDRISRRSVQIWTPLVKSFGASAKSIGASRSEKIVISELLGEIGKREPSLSLPRLSLSTRSDAAPWRRRSRNHAHAGGKRSPTHGMSRVASAPLVPRRHAIDACAVTLRHERCALRCCKLVVWLRCKRCIWRRVDAPVDRRTPRDLLLSIAHDPRADGVHACPCSSS